MKIIKFISHPFFYIVFFLGISFLALIPNAMGWRSNMEGLITGHFYLYLFYVILFLVGYNLVYNIRVNKIININSVNINSVNLILFNIVYLISFLFFFLKFIYIGSIPLLAGDSLARLRMSGLGGFVDYPTKLMSFLGIIAYFIKVNTQKKIYLIHLFIAILLNLLFAERSLVVFTLIGSLIIYINLPTTRARSFIKILGLISLVIFSIGWIQVKRHGGISNLTSKTDNIGETVMWVVHGDLTGSQKFGAYIANKLEDDFMYGNYTFGIYKSLFIPNYHEHGAELLSKKYTNANSAQTIAIPFSYYVDFGYFSLLLAFLIGVITKILYFRFIAMKSPINILLYIAFFFNLLWSVRAGNFPVDPKLLYYLLALLFIFDVSTKNISLKMVVFCARIFFVFSLGVSTLALLIRW